MPRPPLSRRAERIPASPIRKLVPYALAAKIDQQIPHYIVDSPIQYLADWGIAGWIAHEPLSQHFEVVVDDPEQNLGVLRRVTPVPPHATLRWAGLETF